MIEVTNMTKRYGSHVAVDHLSFKVEKGQIYGFLGPNGAGKSTTMNIMTGYLAASEGTVLINGHDVQKEPEKAKRCIGYLPELPPVYTDMTVWEYLDFAAELKKVPVKERPKQINRVMEMTRIVDMKPRLIRNLSKGYRQRVGLAQAILGNPEVIILDEPTVGLDPKQIIEIRDLIKELGEKHTVILSSHILSEVSAVCDHIMIISHGRLVASDSPEGLQKLSGDNAGVRLTVKGSFGEIQKVINKVAGVVGVEDCGGYRTDCVKIQIKVKEDMDVREQVFYALADAKLPILEMKTTVRSLEDIYLELTGEQTAQVEELVEKGFSRIFKGSRSSRRNAENAEEEAEGRMEAENTGMDGMETENTNTDSTEAASGPVAASGAAKENKVNNRKEDE